MILLKRFKFIIKKALYALFNFEIRKIKKFKNKYQGKECYIIGGGNSLKYMDFSHLRDKDSIVMNYIPFHKDFHKLKCEFSVLIAPFFFSKYFGKYPKHFKLHQFLISKEFRKSIDENKDVNFMLNLTNFPYIKNNNIYFNFHKLPENKIKSISNETNIFTGALRYSIALAIYLGYSKAYLIGCDYTFSPSVHHHWFEKGKGIAKNINSFEKDFFKICQQYIDITTVTIDSKSDVLQYITYENLTGYKPNFKENTNLIDSKKLNILKLWEDFNI